MSAPLESVRFARVDGAAPAPGGSVWDMAWPDGQVFARAEVFPGEAQWGVRLADRAPHVADDDLLRLVGNLLVWHVGCRADTVDVVLARTHAHHPLVLVGGAYV